MMIANLVSIKMIHILVLSFLLYIISNTLSHCSLSFLLVSVYNSEENYDNL